MNEQHVICSRLRVGIGLAAGRVSELQSTIAAKPIYLLEAAVPSS